VLALARFIPLRGARRRALAGASNKPARQRRSPTRPVERIRTLFPSLCGIGVAAVAGWLLAGGSLPSARPPRRLEQNRCRKARRWCLVSGIHGWPRRFGLVTRHVLKPPVYDIWVSEILQ
jgi:hypothetical protein